MSSPADNPNTRLFYIGGRWVEPATLSLLDVIDPATETRVAQVAQGSASDVDAAVAAARTAFPAYSASSHTQRVELLRQIVSVYQRRMPEIADALTLEMGAPITLARGAQIAAGVLTANEAIAALERFVFEQQRGSTLLVHEPIGVCGLITAWNWPMFLTFLKVMPALAAGCTMLLKPSEFAPLSAMLFTEVLAEAGVPPGVFNLVQGTGPVVGAAMTAHPGIDMISFTGSTRGGIAVAQSAATTVKRVVQELGGKSANILLPDADFASAVGKGVAHCFNNSGQTCVAPSRMLVPRARHEEAKALARATVASIVVGDPRDPRTTMGPVVGQAQFDKIQALIMSGIDDGAELVSGGTGRPEHLPRGYFVRPTVFAGVRNDMRIAREEIFGPVLCILPYDSEDEAVAIANDSAYGLSGYVQGADLERAHRVAARLRTGTVNINDARGDPSAPIGGYKQSGNGREKSEAGMLEYLETKALLGYQRG